MEKYDKILLILVYVVLFELQRERDIKRNASFEKSHVDEKLKLYKLTLNQASTLC